MAVLLGSDAFTITNQGTEDTYHLTTDINFLPLDFYPYIPTHEYLHNQTLHGTLVVTGLVPATTRALMGASHITPSFKQDFYYRVHFESYSIDFDVVVQDTEITTQIWWAYFDTTDLTDYTYNVDGVLITFPEPPTNIRPLERIPLTIEASVDGDPTIAGDIVLNTSKGGVLLKITGLRTILWTFACPLKDFTESREWYTDVITTRSTETRFAHREQPRISLNYNYRFLSEEQYSLANRIAKTRGASQIAIPQWGELRKVTNVPSGLEIPLDITNLEIQVGDLLLFYVGTHNNFISRILDITEGVITFQRAVPGYTECFIMPVVTGIVPSGVSFSRDTGGAITGSIQVITSNKEHDYEAPIFDTYLDIPILDSLPVVSGSLAEGCDIVTSVYDGVSTNILQFAEESQARVFQQIQYVANNNTELYVLRKLFHYLQGRYRVFWYPSFHNDFEIVGVADSKFIIKYTKALSYPCKYLRVIADTTTYHEVTAVERISSTLERLSVTPIPENIEGVKAIQILRKMRLNSDKVEFQHDKAVTYITAPVIEVN